MRKNRIIKIIVAAVIAAATVIIDQITKYFVSSNMFVGEQIDVIPKVLRWTYVQNRGAAFGSLSNARWIFLVASVVLILVICIYLLKSEKISSFQSVMLALILGGGIGNMIDRIALGYVVDFVDFYFIPLWHWVFNVADACVCVGGILFAVSLLFDESTKKGQSKNG